MEKDGTRELVTLKNCEYLGKVGVRSSDALKQLRLSSGGVAVYVDLHLILYTSPFLSTLVEDLRHCCISGHDEVEILVEPISPDLLHHFKSLLETGECWVKSQHDKEGLEDLIKELGMGIVMTLLMSEKGEESCTDIVISDYEELDDCVEIDGHSSSIGWENSLTPPDETIKDTIADNRSKNEIEESSLLTPERMSHKRKLNFNGSPVILSAVKQKCFVKMEQQDLNEENCVIVKKPFSLNENLHLSKDGAIWENKTPDKQQDFIEKYIEEHIRKNSVEIPETSVNIVKSDSTNFPPKDENCDGTVQCQICQHGNLTEKDLFEHLYQIHIGLQRKIHKSFAKQVPSYYTLERNKKSCSCPICGQVMKAVRKKVGLHWAVDHKQIQKFYEEEINEKKSQELINSAQGSSDNEVSQGTKEKGIETKLRRRKAEVNVGIKKNEEKIRKVEQHDLCVKKPEDKRNLTESPGKAKLPDVDMKKTEEKGRKVEVCDIGVKKTKEKENLTFVQTESPKKTEVPDLGLNTTEETENLTFDCASQDRQVSPLQVMRMNWQKRVQSFVTNITTVGQEVVLEKGESLFPTNTVGDNSQDVTDTNLLEKNKPFPESTIEQEEVVEKVNGSSSLETNMNIKTDKKESLVVLKSLEESMADQEKIDKEKASFALRRNNVSNMNLDIKENSLPKEPKMLKDWCYGGWVLKDSAIEDEKDVIKEKESSSSKINASNNNVDKKKKSLVKESLLLQGSVTGQEKHVKSRKELAPSKITIMNNNGHKKEGNLVKEAQLSQYSTIKQETNVNKQQLPTKKSPSLPDVCSMDTIVDNLKDMDELGTAIIIREASRHRIQNSTGKPKQQLVEELWDHYREFHSVHLKVQCKQSDQKVDFEDKSNYYSPSFRDQIFPETDSESESD